MNLEQLTHACSPLAYFTLLVAQDTQFPLLEAAVCVAQDEYMDLDVQQVLGDVDQLLARLRRKIADDASPLQRLQILNRYFYAELGFAGNANDYYAPDNSHLNVVLRTRKGLPITLAVLWLELAHGIGLTAHGINFPGHFLVKVVVPQGQIVLDPLNAQSLTQSELVQRLEPFAQTVGKGFSPIDDADLPLGIYLQSASGRDIVARMLRNLKEIYRSDHDWDRLVCTQHRLIALQPDAWHEYRDRGLAFAKLRQREAALADLDRYLAHCADAPDREMVLLARAQVA